MDRSHNHHRRHIDHGDTSSLPCGSSSSSSSLSSSLPFLSFSLWHLVADYVELSDILTVRKVCRSWRDGIHQGVSLEQCVLYLEHVLQDEHVTVLQDTATQDWATLWHTTSARTRITQLFLASTTTTPTATTTSEMSRPLHFLDTLLRVLRVLRHFPTQMAVCYNEQWGRHCFGMQWVPPPATTTTLPRFGRDSISGTSEPMVYDFCSRATQNCPTCSCNVNLPTLDASETVRLNNDDAAAADDDDIDDDRKLPATMPNNDTNDRSRSSHNTESFTTGRNGVQQRNTNNRPDLDYNIHDYLSLYKGNQHQHHHQQQQLPPLLLDLTTYTNQCIPNLPSDLVCPVCATSQRRTLLLSEFSYPGTNNGTAATAAAAITPPHPPPPEDEVSPLGHRMSNVLTLTPTRPYYCSGPNTTKEPVVVDRKHGGGSDDHHNDDSHQRSGRDETREETSKRQRLDLDRGRGRDSHSPTSLRYPGADNASVSFPPPSYQDLAIPANAPRGPTTSQNNNGPASGTREDHDDENGNDVSSSSPLSLDIPIPQPLHPKPYVKHVMSIHCVECRRFAMIAPAGLCWSSRFPCLSRSKTITIHNNTGKSSTARTTTENVGAPNNDDKVHIPATKIDPTVQAVGTVTTHTSIATPAATTNQAKLVSVNHEMYPMTAWVGGMLVRTHCSEKSCNRPVFCHECSHATQHSHYPWHSNNGNINNTAERRDFGGATHLPLFRSCIQLQHSSRCDSCRLDYCPAHAWLSTVCHHW